MTQPTLGHMTSKDSDQPVHPPSLAKVLVHPSLDSPEAVEGTCDYGRRMTAQADLCFDVRWLK